MSCACTSRGLPLSYLLQRNEMTVDWCGWGRSQSWYRLCSVSICCYLTKVEDDCRPGASSAQPKHAFFAVLLRLKDEEPPPWSVRHSFHQRVNVPDVNVCARVCPPTIFIFTQQLLVLLILLHILEGFLPVGDRCRLRAHLGQMEILITSSILADLWHQLQVPAGS